MGKTMLGVSIIMAGLIVLLSLTLPAAAGDSCCGSKAKGGAGDGGKTRAEASGSGTACKDAQTRKGCSAAQATAKAGGGCRQAADYGKGPKAGDEVSCPVMGKRFKITEESAYVEIDGRRHYVCCSHCAELLRKEPDKYVKDAKKIKKTDDEWKAELTPEQYQITRCGGTEAPFTGKYWDNKRDGMYRCTACGQPLFSSDTKFESGSGWPSFTAPVDEAGVEEKRDAGHGMERTEVVCTRCEAHLGHVFSDGPQPTGLRYCINSAALDFTEGAKAEDKQ